MSLNEAKMLAAFRELNALLSIPVKLIVGGGGAMLLAHHFKLSTSDIDAVPASGLSITELEPYVRKVAESLSLPGDWLNPHYSSFAHVLPPDYGTRLIEVMSLTHLSVFALSKEDLLIMKCFAARQKDVVHARVLVRDGAQVSFVRSHIEKLLQQKIPGCEKALRFLSEIEAFFADKAE